MKTAVGRLTLLAILGIGASAQHASVDGGPWQDLEAGIFFVLLMAFLLIPSCHAQAIPTVPASPSISDTIDFIRQTLALYGTKTSTVTKSNAPNLAVDTSKYSIGEGSGCQLSILETEHGHLVDYQNKQFDYDATGVVHLDLSRMDPSGVSVSEPKATDLDEGSTTVYTGFEVRIASTNNVVSITGTVPDSRGHTHSLPPQSSTAVFSSSREAADRLAKAFAHAIILCGGNSFAF